MSSPRAVIITVLCTRAPASFVLSYNLQNSPKKHEGLSQLLIMSLCHVKKISQSSMQLITVIFYFQVAMCVKINCTKVYQHGFFS